jgi:hypothetical protein
VGKAHLAEITCPFEQEVLVHPPIKWRCPFKELNSDKSAIEYAGWLVQQLAMGWMAKRLEFAS